MLLQPHVTLQLSRATNNSSLKGHLKGSIYQLVHTALELTFQGAVCEFACDNCNVWFVVGLRRLTLVW